MDLSQNSLGPEGLSLVKNGSGVTFVYDKDKKRRPFVSFIPLLEFLTETNHGSQIKALRQYEQLMAGFASEFDILLKKSYEEIEKNAGLQLSQAIQIVRERKVFVDPGYDGVFGIVKIFKDEKAKSEEKKKAPE